MIWWENALAHQLSCFRKSFRRLFFFERRFEWIEARIYGGRPRSCVGVLDLRTRNVVHNSRAEKERKKKKRRSVARLPLTVTLQLVSVPPFPYRRGAFFVLWPFERKKAGKKCSGREKGGGRSFEHEDDTYVERENSFPPLDSLSSPPSGLN